MIQDIGSSMMMSLTQIARFQIEFIYLYFILNKQTCIHKTQHRKSWDLVLKWFILDLELQVHAIPQEKTHSVGKKLNCKQLFVQHIYIQQFT